MIITAVQSCYESVPTYKKFTYFKTDSILLVWNACTADFFKAEIYLFIPQKKKKKKDGISHTRQHFSCRTSSIRDECICNWQTLNEFPEYVDEVQLTEELNSEKEMERAVIQYLT